MLNSVIYKSKLCMIALFTTLITVSGGCKKDDDKSVPGIDSRVEPVEITFKLVEENGKALEGEAHVILSRPRPDVNMLVTRDEFMLNKSQFSYNIYVPGVLRVTVLKPGYDPFYEDYKLEVKQQELTIKLKEKSGISLLSYNVKDGFEYMNPKLQEKKIIDFVNWVNEVKPDVVVLQELNGFTEEKLADLAKDYGHKHVALLKEGGYPTAITSKTELKNVQRVQIESKVPPFRVHGYVYAETQGINVFALHYSSQSNDLVVQEAEHMIEHARSLENSDKIVFAGDFNSISPLDERFLGSKVWINSLKKYRTHRIPTDYRAIELFENAGYKDVLLLNNSFYKPSFPAKSDYLSSDFMGMRLDYVYLSETLANVCDYAEIIQTNFTNGASDHYPYLLNFKVKNDN